MDMVTSRLLRMPRNSRSMSSFRGRSGQGAQGIWNSVFEESASVLKPCICPGAGRGTLGWGRVSLFWLSWIEIQNCWRTQPQCLLLSPLTRNVWASDVVRQDTQHLACRCDDSHQLPPPHWTLRLSAGDRQTVRTSFIQQVFVECPLTVRLCARRRVCGTGSWGFQIQVGDFDNQEHIINSDDC